MSLWSRVPAPAITPGSDEVAQFSVGQAVQVISDKGSISPTPPEELLGRTGKITNTAEAGGQVRYYVRFDDDQSSDYLHEKWLLPKP